MSAGSASTSSSRESGITAKRTYLNIMLGILTAAMIAAVVLLATITYYQVTDHRAAAEAEAAEVDKSALAAQVTRGVQGMIDRNDSMQDYDIRYDDDMVLFQVTENGTYYEGMVTARTQLGTEVPVAVTVYADGSGAMMYHVDPADLMRLRETASDEQG